MGLFDIFKKKKSDATFPENELERSLMQAVSNVSAQKEFYQKLLWNELYVLTNENSLPHEGVQTLEQNTTVQIAAFEGGQIPIFTAVNRIFDKGVIKKQVPYLSMKGQDIFEVAKGATFILNPFSELCKELIPQEIERLMDGSIYENIDKEIKQEEFNKIFERAGKKQKGLIFLEGYRGSPLKPEEQVSLEESILDFQRCLEIYPDHWQSMVMMAKSYQRLEKHTEALAQLELAFNTEKENHIIPMEASLEAMHLNDLDKAIFYSEESLKRKPNDFVLMGNFAMNLLVAQKDQEAQEMIEKAIQMNPDDSINRNIESVIKGVLSGNRARPTFKDAIK